MAWLATLQVRLGLCAMGRRGIHQLHDYSQLIVFDNAVKVVNYVRVLHRLQQPDLVHAFISLA